MKRHRFSMIAILAVASILEAAAPSIAAETDARPLRIVTTLGVLADLAREVGGSRVEVDTLSDPARDPHYVQARPTLMKKARDADVLIEVGLDLELWAELVAEGAANPKIQRGQPGRIIASKGVRRLEIPSQLTRAQGHIHPYGNPHIWLDPVRAREMAETIADGFAAIDPEHATTYEKGLDAFRAKLDEALFGADLVEEVGGDRLVRLAEQDRLLEWLERRELADRLGGWFAELAPLRGASICTYHKTWIYFTERFGMTVRTEIEEKPGIAPSARHREHVIREIGQSQARLILMAGFHDRRIADAIAERAAVPVLEVPIDVGADGSRTYIAFFDALVDRILEAANAR